MRAIALRCFRSAGVSLLLFPILVGCAHGKSPRTRSLTSGGRADAITRREIDSLMVQYANAYDLIFKARPNMLLSRDVRLPYPMKEGLVSEPSGVKVFVDAVYLGNIDTLRRLPSRSIVFIQHLSPVEATTRYGSGMVAGAIVITTGARWR